MTISSKNSKIYQINENGCLDSMNSEVNSLLSHNANHNLMRVEGLMNVVLVGDKIIIPPIYGDCYETIGRYKKIVNFIVENII